MSSRRWFFVAALCLWLAGCSASSDSGLPDFPEAFPPAGPIRVPQDFATIAEAVARASPGDTVLVAPGVYNESVPVPRAITLQGSGPNTILNADPGLPALFVAAGARISGFRLNGETRVLVVIGDDGAPLAGVQLENLLISASDVDGIGLLFQNAPGIRITDCRIEAHAVAVGGGLFGGPSPDAVLTRVTAVLLGGAAGAVGFFFGNTPNLRLVDSVSQGPDVMPRTVAPLPLSAIGLQVGDLEGAVVAGVTIEDLEIDLPGDQTQGALFGNTPGMSFQGSVIAGVNGIIVETADGTAVPGVVIQNFQIALAGPAVGNAIRCVNTPALLVRAGIIDGGARGVQLLSNQNLDPVPSIRVEEVGISATLFGVAGQALEGVLVDDCAVDGPDFGILFLQSVRPTIRACRVENAGTAIQFEESVEAPRVEDNVVVGNFIGLNFLAAPLDAILSGNAFIANSFGVGIAGGSAELVRNRFDTHQIAVDCLGDAQLLCANNLILNSSQAGLLAEQASFTLAHNNVAAGNATGMLASDTAGLTAVSNIFLANGAGLEAVGIGPVISDFNDYFGNLAGDGPFGIPPGPADISIDPLFVDFIDFVLQPGSPVIDAGHPDLDDVIPPGQGTVRNDMGAYGGPEAGAIPPQPALLTRTVRDAQPRSMTRTVPTGPDQKLGERLDDLTLPAIPHSVNRWRLP